MIDPPFDSDRAVSRRKFILGGATLLGGVGVMTLTSDRTRAEVSMDTLNVQGDTAELSQPPSSVTLTVTGDWEIGGPAPEQSRVILQVEHDATSRDMDEFIDMDTPASGSYQLAAELLDHPEIYGSDLLPAEPGQVTNTEIVVRVILLAINSGEISAESYVEDTASIQLTNDGLELAVGGSGAVNVTA